MGVLPGRSTAADTPSAPTSPDFEQLVKTHGPAIQRLVRGYERDPQQQQELRQDILLNLWRSLPSFQGRSSERTWVLKVAHNVAITHVTRAARNRSIPNATIEELSQSEPAGEDGLDRSRMMARIQQIIDRLRPQDRQLVMLYLEGMPQAEIAEVMGLTVSNVSTRIHRLKGLLATQARKGR